VLKREPVHCERASKKTAPGIEAGWKYYGCIRRRCGQRRTLHLFSKLGLQRPYGTAGSDATLAAAGYASGVIAAGASLLAPFDVTRR
jgi:hypothetical protein